jgi:hypothetical protein
MRSDVYEDTFNVKAHKETKRLFEKLLVKMAAEKGCVLPRATAFEELIDRMAKLEEISL